MDMHVVQFVHLGRGNNLLFFAVFFYFIIIIFNF